MRAGSLLFLLALLFALSLATAHADSPATTYDPIVHIRLAHFFSGASVLAISCDHAFIVKDLHGDTLVSGTAGQNLYARASQDDHLALSGNSSNTDAEASQAGDDTLAPAGIPTTAVTISPSASGSFLQIALPGPKPKWHRYRGEITLTAADSQIRLTNDISLEEYLCGVLKPEIGASAPLEALKAQAVAARTYAVRNIGHLASEGADLDDTTRTQSYLGVDGETPAVYDAVRATAGLIMSYQGQPIEAFYSTDCGGVTAEGAPGEPYLRPVSDPDCAAKPAWTKTYTKLQLQTALQRSPATAVGSLASLSIESIDTSGRAVKVLISGENGQTKEVTGAELRGTLGTEELRSTLFTVRATDGGFVFTGRGWGHGLGMCQQGAIALAQGADRQSYDHILKHYYAGIEIVPLTPALVAAALLANGKSGRSHEISFSAVSSGGKS